MLRILFILIVSLLLLACTKEKELILPVTDTVEKGVAVDEELCDFIAKLHPHLQGMHSWQELEPSVRKSLTFLNRQNPDKVVLKTEEYAIHNRDIVEAQKLLLEILPQLDKNRNLLLEKFSFIRIPSISYTGYYSPVVKVSKVYKKGYVPIYKCPAEIANRKRGEKFFTRREIMNGALSGRGLEIAYAKNPFEAFILEVQGSGYLEFENGHRISVNYDGQNGHRYKSTRKILTERKILNNPDINAQRAWFNSHPNKAIEVLNENPSYVFFRVSKTTALGCTGVEVEAYKSLAVDKRVIPYGACVLYGVNMIDSEHRGIGFAHDTGGAIKNNRIDIYCGDTSRACKIASTLDAKGPAWIMLKKS